MKNIEISLTPAQANYLEEALVQAIAKNTGSAARAKAQGSDFFAKAQEEQAQKGWTILHMIRARKG